MPGSSPPSQPRNWKRQAGGGGDALKPGTKVTLFSHGVYQSAWYPRDIRGLMERLGSRAGTWYPVVSMAASPLGRDVQDRWPEAV